MDSINTNQSLRRTVHAGYASVAIMLAIFGGWAATADLNGAVIANATIVVESYSKKVQQVDGGTISRIMVKDGDRVVAGQDLVTLDPTDAKAELAIIDGLLDELLVKRARLEAQRDGAADLALPPQLAARSDETALSGIVSGQRKLLASTMEAAKGKAEQLKRQIEQLGEQIKGQTAQFASKQKQAQLIASELENLRSLQAKGLVPNSRVLAVEREAAQLDGEQAELRASRAAAEARIGEVKLQIIQLGEELRTEALTELRDVETRIAELQEKRIATASRLLRTTIKSPITGTIYQLAIHTEGGVVAAGETLMLIVPEGDDLVLQAEVAPNDIDEIAVGQPARIRFPAFASRVTPEISATVTQVAADTSRNEQNSPPFYAVRLTIAAKEIEKLGDKKLKPGMAAEAFIQTEARSPLSYLVKPLIDQFAYAMRES